MVGLNTYRDLCAGEQSGIIPFDTTAGRLQHSIKSEEMKVLNPKLTHHSALNFM